MPEFRMIPIEKIVEPPQPVRFAMDDEKFATLCESVKRHGILQNIGVYPVGELFEISFGHRRYRAACAVELKELPCRVFADKEVAREVAMLEENLEREDITAAEEAVKYAELIEKYDFTEDQLLNFLHKPASYVYGRLDLLNKDKGVFQAVADRKIVLSVAQQLNRVDHTGHCAYLLRMAIENGASARIVAGWVVDYKRNGPGQVVDLAPLVEQGKASIAPAGGPECVLCKSSGYPANIKWVPIHDFELDALLANIAGAAQLPAEAEADHA